MQKLDEVRIARLMGLSVDGPAAYLWALGRDRHLLRYPDMLRNPFTPTEIASLPEDFYGRVDELRTLERSLVQGSVAIQGPVGIGKSSLLARGLAAMEGFDAANRARSVVVVGDREVDTVDKAARLLIHQLVDIDEAEKKVIFKLGNVFEREAAEIVRNFVDGHHLEILKRLVEAEYVEHLLNNDRFLILAIGEADKCPVAIARLVRSIVTHTQQHGVRRVRFLLAGVRPFFQAMVDEDPGVGRFFTRTITLEPMPDEEATDLMEAKFAQAVDWAEEDGAALSIDPTVVEHVVALAGGHPHLLQLLASHLIEHEDDDPDGIVDGRDLANSLRRICYEDRARVYDSTLHELDVHGRLESLESLLELADAGFPTMIDRRAAAAVVEPEEIHWLTEHNVLVARPEGDYGLVDEFLRIRMVIDAAESEAERARAEQAIIDDLYLGGELDGDLPDDYMHDDDEASRRGLT